MEQYPPNPHEIEVQQAKEKSALEFESPGWRDTFKLSMRRPKPVWALAALALQLL